MSDDARDESEGITTQIISQIVNTMKFKNQ